jgi:hypothetical protein
VIRPLAAAAAVGLLAAGCGSAAASQSRAAGGGGSPRPAATASTVPSTTGPSTTGPAALGPQVPTSSPSAPRAGQADPALEKQLPSRLNGVALRKASTTGSAIFAEFGGTAWARQMTSYLTSVGKTPADLSYAQVWDPSGALGLDAGVFQAGGITAAALRNAIISSTRPDSPDLTTSASTISGKTVTVVANGNSGSTLYLYDHGGGVFYIGGADASLVAKFLRAIA